METESTGKNIWEKNTVEMISGLTNWQLIIQRDEKGITILRALTCDRNAFLPDELFGLPVIALQDHALAYGMPAMEGEELRVLGGVESGNWDNRNITELTLPRFLLNIGNYAFMNLHSLEMLRFFDDLCSTGTASFMNCRSFSRLELTRIGLHQGSALSNLVQSLQQELAVTIRETDGSITKLIFPEYFENYIENNAAHHFELKIIGGGYPYHGVFRDKTLLLADYDALWTAYLAHEHDEECALRLAYSRFRYPTGLSKWAEERYTEYLRTNIGRALSLALIEKDMTGLRLLLDLNSLNTETLNHALIEARTMQITEGTAILLEKRHMSLSSGKEKTFEL